MNPYPPTLAVTGASGFLGRVVADRLAHSHTVLRLGHTHGGPDIERLDLREAEAVRAWAERTRPDVVIHGAAYRDPDFCEAHPDETERLNAGAVRNLCAALPPGARLIFISTDYVFDGLRPPHRETDPYSPVQEYGRSKVRGEQAALARPGSLVLRIPLLMGAAPDFAGSGFLAQILQQHLKRTEPHECDHALIRYPTWIADVAEAIAFLLERHAAGIYHMSGADRMTRYDAVCAAVRVLGFSCAHVRPSRFALPRAAARPPDSALATDKIRSLGFRHFTPFDDVVRAFARAFPGECRPE
ncbi:MAG: SDR family oxidoreductase [Kiritimatiellae bacterium]|nr:SDR family oxidoreductase [Kiritimatiellia bacterium]